MSISQVPALTATTITDASANTATVDSTQHALRTASRPDEIGLLSARHLTMRSGLITGAAVVANAPLFSARWADATRFCVIHRVRAHATVTTAMTAAQELGLNLVKAISFSVSDSGGTAQNATGSGTSLRGSMGTGLFGATDIQIATTTLLTAGTRTIGGINMADVSAWSAAVGTDFGFDWQQTSPGEHPLVLAQNDGILVRNSIILPAAGAFRLTVELSWSEVTAY